MDLIKRVAESGWVGPVLGKMPLLDRKKLKDVYNNWKITKHEKEVIREAKKKDLSVLISGFAKSGNTWARFVMFNYLYVRDKKIEKNNKLRSLERGAEYCAEQRDRCGRRL